MVYQLKSWDMLVGMVVGRVGTVNLEEAQLTHNTKEKCGIIM
jgi:hypothetical protein